MEPATFLKYVKDQYDRLQEISPLLPPEVIDEFSKKFANEKEISKPEEANGLEKITVFRNDIDLNVSDPGDARSIHSNDRTPKLALPRVKTEANIAMTNPMLKAARMIAKQSEVANPLREIPAVKTAAATVFNERGLMTRAAQMAKRVSPDVLSAAAPSPPTPPSEKAESISSLEGTEAVFVAVVPEEEKKEAAPSS
jgi:hypothetical protein